MSLVNRSGRRPHVMAIAHDVQVEAAVRGCFLRVASRPIASQQLLCVCRPCICKGGEGEPPAAMVASSRRRPCKCAQAL